MSHDMNLNNINMPSWVKPRPAPWKYAGWISREPAFGRDFDEVIKAIPLISDHGEIREVDIYEEGAAEWLKDPSDAP